MIYERIRNSKRGMIAALIDPDTNTEFSLKERIENIENSNVDFLFIGGSTLFNREFDEFVKEVKRFTHLPIIIFPGSSLQISSYADAILFLSLISGRNPQFLIGEHVRAAPRLKKMNIEIIPTGYMIIESGSITTVEFISNTKPIPRGKVEIAVAHALAGEMLGFKLLYLDAGSGAREPVPDEMVKEVKNNVKVPLIVGGGITSQDEIERKFQAGADIVVVGSLLEKKPGALKK